MDLCGLASSCRIQSSAVCVPKTVIRFTTKGSLPMAGGAAQHSFSGHETFPFRYPWLKKGFDAVQEDPFIFLRDNAITTLGVGKNMVRAIRHWCLTTGVIEESPAGGGALRVTGLGK